MLYLVDYGSLTYSYGFAILPFIFLASETYLRSGRAANALASGLLYGLLMLFNTPTAYAGGVLLLLYVAAEAFIGRQAVRAFKLLLLTLGSSLAVSAFWLIPYLYFSYFSGLNLLWTPPSGRFPQDEIVSLRGLFTPNLESLKAGYLGHVILVPGLLSIVVARTRKATTYYLLGLFAIFLTAGAMFDFYYWIPFILIMQFPKRFLILDVFFLSLLTSVFFAGLGTALLRARTHLGWGNKRIGEIISLVLVIALIVFSFQAVLPQRSPRALQPLKTRGDTYEAEAFEYLAEKAGFFRVMAIDRWHSWFPMYTQKGSIDGWYDQAIPTITRHYTYQVYYSEAKEVNASLKPLSILGVRYVMIYYAFNEEGRAGLQKFEHSEIAPPVFVNDRVAIFENPGAKLLYIAAKGLAISATTEKEEAELLYTVTTMSAYDPEKLVLLRSDRYNDMRALPVEPYAPGMELIGEAVSYRVDHLKFEETRISVRVYVEKPAFVYLSASYFPGWRVDVDGEESLLLVAEPNFMAVYLTTPGLHTVEFSYGVQLIKTLSAMLSVLAVAVLFSYHIISWKGRHPHAVFAAS